MPQLLGLALLGAGVLAGYRAFRHAAQRMREELDRAADSAQSERPAEAGAIKDLGALELDPKSGVYRPRER